MKELEQLNNYIFYQATKCLRDAMPTDEERREATRKEIEKLNENPNEPENKILLEFYDLCEQHRQEEDEEKKGYLFGAMKNKQVEYDNLIKSYGE